MAGSYQRLLVWDNIIIYLVENSAGEHRLNCISGRLKNEYLC